MTWVVLAACFLVVSHFGISSTGLRPWLVTRLGENLYRGVFALVALAAVVLLVMAWRRAPYVHLWDVGLGLQHVPLLIMPLALILAVCGLSAPNPTSAGQERSLAGAESARGILRITRHPFLWGAALWALSHIAANGDAATVVFFGAFLALALAGAVLIDRKKARQPGDDWAAFRDATSLVPFAAIVAGRQRLVFGEIGWWRLLLALVLYVVLLFCHPWFAGVPGLP
jgi:uncharacterized membrane protein